MPRHTFRIGVEMRNAVQRYVAAAIARVDPRRYNQEATYVTALAHAMEGVAYDGPDGRVSFTSTVFDDRGPKSAESRLGADIAITAEIEQAANRVRKAILVQAKLGTIADLPNHERQRLRGQVQRMREHTRSPKVMEIPGSDGLRDPKVMSGIRLLQDQVRRSVPLPSYITSRVLTTLDGDTRPAFVNLVQDSRAQRIHVVALLTGGRASQATVIDD
jgi:hypothetical protein